MDQSHFSTELDATVRPLSGRQAGRQAAGTR